MYAIYELKFISISYDVFMYGLNCSYCVKIMNAYMRETEIESKNMLLIYVNFKNFYEFSIANIITAVFRV